jgi:predicted deacetylase
MSIDVKSYNSVRYLARLDDACPHMDTSKWDRLEDIFDRYNIRPIVAVIPENKDSGLMINESDPGFWEKVKHWQKKGWIIALHGYQHVYETKNSGIVKLNSYSEFAGLPLERQKDKVSNAIKIFKEHGIFPDIWVAPAHSFDKNTLLALKSCTEIKIISDGFSEYPFQWKGFTWLPVQEWRFATHKKGIWTTCFHPNAMKEDEFIHVDDFLKHHAQEFVANLDALLREYKNRKRTINDQLIIMNKINYLHFIRN